MRQLLLYALAGFVGAITYALVTLVSKKGCAGDFRLQSA